MAAYGLLPVCSSLPRWRPQWQAEGQVTPLDLVLAPLP